MNKDTKENFEPYYKASANRVLSIAKEIERLSPNIDVGYKQIEYLAKEIVCHCALCHELDLL